MKLIDEFRKILGEPKQIVTYRVYRLMGGTIHRQDVKGGRWEPLSTNEANKILSKLDIDLEDDILS